MQYSRINRKTIKEFSRIFLKGQPWYFEEEEYFFKNYKLTIKDFL